MTNVFDYDGDSATFHYIESPEEQERYRERIRTTRREQGLPEHTTTNDDIYLCLVRIAEALERLETTNNS